MKCCLCEKQATTKHHVSYLPVKIVFVCKSCHRKIHHGLFIELLPTNTRFAKIRFSNKGRIRVFKKGKWWQRPLTEYEKLLRVEMLKEEKELFKSH